MRVLSLGTAWGLAMTTSAALNLYFLNQSYELRTKLLLMIFFSGGLFGFMLTGAALRFSPSKWKASQRFSAAFLTLLLLTIGFTALIFALHFRIYFAQWHDDQLSIRLVFETAFTLMSAVYQFLVLGLRLYLPVGFIALLGASWAFAFQRI